MSNWDDEIELLRAIVRETKLDEETKWGKPCFSHEGSNIAIIQPFKGCLALMYFKGMMLKDEKGLLVDNGPNSRSAKRLEFRSLEEVAKRKATIKAYIKEAVALEKAGVKAPKAARKAEPLPAELKAIFAKKPALKAAFAALTPGRQRAYLLHFSGAKQAATRTARIEKCIPAIMAGKGLNDR
jgi:uncharacterized protein YdeI (YjbR/CyaY-like superfamily)